MDLAEFATLFQSKKEFAAGLSLLAEFAYGANKRGVLSEYIATIGQETQNKLDIATITSNSSGTDANYMIVGSTGNDTIGAGNGNDTLEGRAGNDRLEGGRDNDTYIFGRGDGAVTIYDNHGNDTIKFKEGISKEDLTFMFNGNNLSIRYGEGDSITVNNYVNNPAYQIEKIELKGGNFITNSQINKIIQDINAYAKDNGITGISHDAIRNN